MRRPAALVLILLGLLSGARTGVAQEFRQVYLVQNSGWMEPFFTDPQSQFRPLVAELVGATQLDGVPIAVAAFDQDGQVVGSGSPRFLYRGAWSKAAVDKAVGEVGLRRKTAPGAGGGYTDADFYGALTGAITSGLGEQDGVIWMVTNNKNSPSNSQEVSRLTQDFYGKLRSSDAITRLVAFPIGMAVTGQNRGREQYREGGFVVYGIGYGPAGAKALDVLLRPGAPLSALFSHPPVRIKPLDEAPIELALDRLDSADPTRLQAENGVLKLTGVPAEAGDRLRFKGRVRSTFYPQRIVSGRVELSMRPVVAATGPEAGEAASASAPVAAVDPPLLENIPPGGTSPEIDVEITLPPIDRPPGMFGWFARDRVVDGVLDVRLRDLVLDLDPDFLSRVRPIFGSDLIGSGQARTLESQLPDVFLDFKRISETRASVPVRFVATYSPWPAIAALGGGLLVLGLLAAGGILGLRARTHKVALGTYSRQARLKPFRPEVMTAPDGSRWRVAAGLFGRATASRLDATSSPGAVRA